MAQVRTGASLRSRLVFRPMSRYGSPWGHESFCVAVVDDPEIELPLDAEPPVPSDPAGNVVLLTERIRRAGSRWVVVWFAKDPRSRGAFAVPRGFGRDAVVDVGDVVVSDARLLAAGVVVDRAGQPVEGANVQILIPREGTPRWRWGSSKGRSDGRGRFELRFETELEEIGLTAGSRFHCLRAPVSISPGDRDVRLVVDGAGAVSGRLLLAPDVPARELHVALEGIDGESMVVMNRTSRTRAPWNWRTPLDRDGTFSFDGVPPGHLAVVIRLGPTGPEVERLDDLVVPSGGTAIDPRLELIDLRGRLRLVTIKVQDGSGRPIRGAHVRTRVADSERSGPAVTRGNGVASVVMAVGMPMDIQVSHPLYRSIRIAEVKGPRTVVLADFVVATVRVVCPEPLPLDRAWWVMARPVDASGKRLPGEVREQKLDPDGTGRLRFPASGRYGLVLLIRSTQPGGSVAAGLVREPKDPVIVVAENAPEAIHDVVLSRTAVRNALEQVR